VTVAPAARPSTTPVVQAPRAATPPAASAPAASAPAAPAPAASAPAAHEAAAPAPTASAPAPDPSKIAREPISAMPHYTVMSAPVAGSGESFGFANPPALKPGAIEMIQQRLLSVGALQAQQASSESAAMRSALTRFQEANHLPLTGEPDVATVLKLGLDPKNIFEQPTTGP
jgi:hypothetical protein